MLALIIDENFNQRILRGLLRATPHLDFIVVQDIGLKGAGDPAVLSLAAENNRILLTHDVRTIPKFVFQRIRSGLPMPGVVAVSDQLPIGSVIDDLSLLVECATPAELENQIIFLPLE